MSDMIPLRDYLDAEFKAVREDIKGVKDEVVGNRLHRHNEYLTLPQLLGILTLVVAVSGLILSAVL